jgi:hypothetical protein
MMPQQSPSATPSMQANPPQHGKPTASASGTVAMLPHGVFRRDNAARRGVPDGIGSIE